MICPHCEQSLLRKERPGNVCGKCGRRYALDPKTNPLRLNDLRVRRVAAKLTEEGRLRCTTGQLWYALSRKSLKDSDAETGCGGVAALFGLVLGVVGLISGAVLFAVLGGLLLVTALGLLIAAASGWRRGRARVSRESFRTELMRQWTDVYGSLPPGVMSDRQYPSPRPSPRTDKGRAAEAPASEPGSGGLVLLCPDPSVAVCIDAAGLPARHGLRLVATPDELPAVLGPSSPGTVLLLHDADAAGLTLAHRVREAYPEHRVVDLGLPPDAARDRPNAVPVRGEPPGDAVMDVLRRSGEYPPDQLKRLSKGWGLPLVAVPPAKLLAVVTRAVERAGTATDPERRRAASLGFMTWPGGGGG
ncbi:hypothetical protein [Streptomyces sp. NPDC005301]|uniref:hypothetical protein n=1 Tax=Streptomyces sp. NPDC005301 TaxID=3156874 RepID=UPI0033B0158F